MFQKINEERKNQNCNENKTHILRNKNERKFNYDDFFIRFNFKKHRNLNRKKHEIKDEQIVERASLQRIRSVLSKIKKQYKLIHEKKTL